MADRTDVDDDAMPDATPEDTRLNDNNQRMQRSSGTTATTEQGDLMGFPESKTKGFVTSSHEGLGGRDPKETTAYKQIPSFVSASIQDHRINVPTLTKEKLQQIPRFIGLSSRSREAQPGSDMMIVEDLRARLGAQRKHNEMLEKLAQDAGSKVALLQSQIDSSKQVIEKFQQESQHHVEEIQGLMDSYEAMSKMHEAEKRDDLETIARLNEQINTLTSTSDQLRQMLVPVSEKQVLDSEVVSRFTSLHSSIMALVRQTWRTTLKEDVEPRLLSRDQHRFFISSFPLSYNRLRSLVSEAIGDIILGSQNYFLEDSFQELEQKIKTVERALARTMPKEHRVRVIEWRNATFKATETFRGSGSEISATAQYQIWHFLSPLQLKDTAAEQTGQEKLKALCDNAVELSLMMRQLKDDFWIDDMSFVLGKQISRCGKGVEGFESLTADNDHQPGTIAYVITGALVKRAKENMGNTLVLEKAQVAVYE